MPKVNITLSIEVHDPEELTEYAKKQYEKWWGEHGWEPENLGEAAYEALIASNDNPEAPLDYGIEIIDWNADSYPA